MDLKDFSKSFGELLRQPDCVERVSVTLLRKEDLAECPLKYSIETLKDVRNTLINNLYEQFCSNSFLNMEVRDYDAVVEQRGTVGLIELENDEAIASIAQELGDKNSASQIISGLSESDFSDYMVEITGDEHVYRAIGRISTTSKLKKFGWFGNLDDNKLKSLDFDVIGMSQDVDTVIIDNKTVLVLGNQGFERVFGLKTVFIEKASQALSSPVLSDHLAEETVCQLLEKTKTGGRIARRISKIMQDETRLRDFFANPDKYKAILDDATHPYADKFTGVHIESETGNLYADSGKEEHLINLISDACYMAEVSGHHGYDGAR